LVEAAVVVPAEVFVGARVWRLARTAPRLEVLRGTGTGTGTDSGTGNGSVAGTGAAGSTEANECVSLTGVSTSSTVDSARGFPADGGVCTAKAAVGGGVDGGDAGPEVRDGSWPRYVVLE
jgi:hypothetical protein